jgi:hypothetical protein
VGESETTSIDALQTPRGMTLASLMYRYEPVHSERRERSGRTYGESHKGVMVLYPDGTVEEIKRLNEEKLKVINELLNGEW